MRHRPRNEENARGDEQACEHMNEADHGYRFRSFNDRSDVFRSSKLVRSGNRPALHFLDARNRRRGAPQDRPWMWASGHSADSVKRAAHGYAATREAAMAAFAKSWRR
jgi:hypothetical protein